MYIAFKSKYEGKIDLVKLRGRGKMTVKSTLNNRV
jgi:hypothetical protein